MRPTPIVFYGLITGLLEPLAPLILRRRATRGREDPARLGERLGHASAPRPDGPLVWLHGVSVGEATSLLPLIAALRAHRPDIALLVTSGTLTAANMLSRRLPSSVTHQYLPLDTPRAVRRFLDHWRPGLAIFVESELWPNLITEAYARGVKLGLVSARMTEKSARGWGRYPVAAHAIFSAFDLILPQDAATAARVRRLGGTAGPNLNLKLAGVPLPADDAELARLRAAIGGRKVVLAASTHPGEEALIAEAVRAADRPALLIVAPRHPERGPEIARDLGAGLRSAGGSLDGPVYVADTLGELGLFFRLANVVVMGGSFVPDVGGHNPLEPARIGRPIVTGPHAFNAADIYAAMFADGAALEAADGAELARHVQGLLDNPHIACRLGEAALAFVDRQGAALGEAMSQLEPLLPA